MEFNERANGGSDHEASRRVTGDYVRECGKEIEHPAVKAAAPPAALQRQNSDQVQDK